jgi:multidrug efflux pump subunit AcrB/ABC-type multidrug transport system ATPase subunit
MTSFALKRPVTIFMIAAGLCLLGVISWQRLSVQLLPQFIFPEVFLNTGMAGASPEKIERELVIPIEGEVATLEDVHDIESQVRSDFANIKVSFNHGTNMKFALLKLQQKMSALENRLPEGTRISVDKFDTADLASFLMQMSIRGDATLEDLRDVAERQVRRRLEQIDGVVNVHVGGGDQRTVGIEIDEDRCEAMNIPVGLVQQKINAFHRRPEHLGRVLASGNVMDVILLGQVDDLQEMSDLVIEPTSSVKLSDVARIGYVHAQRTQLFRVDGKSSVGIFVQKDNTSNMLQVSASVLKEIDAINADLEPTGYVLVVNFNQAALIQTAITRVEKLAIAGAVLAIVVLFLFLRNVRFVTILLIAIPLSLLVTFNFMFGFDLSVNILSLCGLALALGMLVDNGIVVMENVFYHRQRGEEPSKAALIGTKEVGRSIFAATATTILVFLPVLFVESEAKLFVRELALSVIFPLSVSLVVALTVIPLLASRSLKGKPVRSFKSGRVLEIYRLLLKSAIRHRVRTASLVGVLLAITLFIGATFIVQQASAPPLARLDMYVTMPRGATLDATDVIVRRMEEQILGLTDVKEVRTNVRAEEAHISAQFLEPAKRTQPLQLSKEKEKIKKQNERLEHVDLAFDRPRRGGSIQRRDELSSFLSSEEGMSLKGHDLQALTLLNEQITQTLQTIPEIDRRSVNSDLQGGAPELQIRGDRLQLALAGLSMEQVMQAIWATRTEGSRASTPFAEAGGDVDISLQLQNSQQRQLDDVRRMKVRNESGHYIPLEQVADVRVDTGPGNIVRHNQERQVKITYSFLPEAEKSKTRLDLAKAQIEFLMQSIRLPRGFTLEKLQPEDQRVYYWMIAIGAILIYMFLAAQFESLSSPLVILGTVPTAIIGALVALTLTGTPLSMGQGAPMALLGLIVLLGIVVNNGIILLDRIAILRNQHGYCWQRAVLAAGQSRVRPIIMTSTTTILGLLPLALKQGTEFELWPPFAITVLGGLAVSSFATLIFIPVLYVGLEQTKDWLKKIGWLGISLSTLATIAITYWFYQEYKSLLKTSLLVLPLWFVILGLIYIVKQFFTIRSEKKRLAEQRLNIKIQNLTKIYGSPGRFTREWTKQKRRWSKVVAEGKLPWQKEDLKESTIWVITLGLLFGYLHYFLTSGFWLTILSCFTLVWFHSARELWYRWGFLRGNPPQNRSRARRWRFRKNKRQEEKEEAPDSSVSPLDFKRRGTIIAVLMFLAYLQLRIEAPALTIVALILSLLLMRFTQISRKIESGKIDPEQPVGRLRKIKRGIYTVTKALPFIRPPKQQVTALHSVNLDIGKGMFGLLGPNGAGKTTLMRILVGVLEENRGSITINGRKLSEHRETFHGAIGYLPQDFGLYENMTPLEYLHYHALTNGIYEPESRKELIENIVKSVGLWERRDDKVKTFSGGMKQRVGIAQTLLHLPQIIVVDEPTAGLDPKERIRFRNLLSELAKERIVVFSTHIVEDISSTCENVAVLSGGRLLYKGSPGEMQIRARGKVFEAVVSNDELSRLQKSLKIVQHSKANGGVRMRFLSDKPVEEFASSEVEPTLEDAYVFLLGQSSQTRN